MWFDRDELVGGDAWDQKIRRQIKDCTLFMPVISANTNARAEGYFRLEWKLAVDRSHLMADDAPFLFPVVIDDTGDAAARVFYDKVGFGRDDLALADDFAKRATDAEPTVAFCWGVRAHVQAAFLFRGFAVGDEFVQRARDAQSFANRAIALQADEVEALLALGRVATYQRA